MNSKERFYAVVEYGKADRVATIHHGTPEINKKLMDYFGVD